MLPLQHQSTTANTSLSAVSSNLAMFAARTLTVVVHSDDQSGWGCGSFVCCCCKSSDVLQTNEWLTTEGSEGVYSFESCVAIRGRGGGGGAVYSFMSTLESHGRCRTHIYDPSHSTERLVGGRGAGGGGEDEQIQMKKMNERRTDVGPEFPAETPNKLNVGR